MNGTETDLFHVGLNTANKEWVGHAEGGHESMKGVLRTTKLGSVACECHLKIIHSYSL